MVGTLSSQVDGTALGYIWYKEEEPWRESSVSSAVGTRRKSFKGRQRLFFIISRREPKVGDVLRLER